MPTPITTLPLAELAEMYDNAWLLKRAKQLHPTLFAWQLTSIEVDMAIVWQAMLQKIPSTHLYEIKQLLHDTRHH